MAIVVDVALSAGWTIDHVLDTVTMTRLQALRKHWDQYPPVHKMVAAFTGYKPKGETRRITLEEFKTKFSNGLM